jgi:tryprostatin B 6-hydroxylase
MVTHTFPGILAVCVGFCSHWTYFIHGERDLAAAKIARTHLLAFFVLLCLKWHYEALSVGRAGLETALLSAFYASALFTSIIVYRLFLSPLRSIPGPLSMRISKLVHVWQMADPKKQNCKVLHAMQAKYGKAVRTGKSPISIFLVTIYKLP